MNKKLKNAFTLVELVIVIAVIAVLAAVLIPVFAGILARARDTANYQQAVMARNEFLSTYADSSTDIENSIIVVEEIAYKINTGGQLQKLEGFDNFSMLGTPVTLSNGAKVFIVTTDNAVAYDTYGLGYSWDSLLLYDFLSVSTNEETNALMLSAGENVDMLVTLQINSMITEVDSGIFNNCTNLKEVILPKSLKNISDYMFTNCENLVSIEIPNTIETIGIYAFENCVSLESINLSGASLTSISENILSGCTSLKTITIPFVGKSASTTSGTNSLFGYLFGSKEFNGSVETIQYYASNSYCTYFIPYTLEEVIVTSATSIPYGAFSNCKTLKNITLNKEITYINASIFSGCSSLEKVTMPMASASSSTSYSSSKVFGYFFTLALDTQNYTQITQTYYAQTGTHQYGYVSSDFYIPNTLKEVYITNSTNLNETAFYGFSGIEKIDFTGSTFKTIQSKTFYGCTSLNTVVLPDNITTINDSVFYGCGFTDLSSFSNISLFGASMFANNLGFTDLVIPANVKTLGSSTFTNCSNITSVSFEENSLATSIGDSMFTNLPLLKTVDLTNAVNLTSIGGSSFANCTSLDTVIYGENSALTSIGSYAFDNCYNITSVDLPNTLSYLGAGAFRDCYQLSNLSLPFIGGCNQTTYSGTQSVFGHIFGKNVQTEGYTEISQTYYAQTGTHQYGTLTSTLYVPTCLKEVKITNCKYMNTGAFTGVITLEKIDFTGSTFTTISQNAFKDCTNLKTIILPNTITTINANAFDNCGFTDLSSFKNLSLFGASMFANNLGLTDLVIPNNIKALGSSTFTNCSNLTTVSFEEGSLITSLSASTFANCANLITIDLTNATNLTSIGESCFANCVSLNNIIYGENSKITSIGSYSYDNCIAFTSIDLPETITSIGLGAFRDCVNLTKFSSPIIGGSNKTTYSTTYGVFGHIFGNNVQTEGYTTISQTYRYGLNNQYYVKTLEVGIPTKLQYLEFTNQQSMSYGALSGLNCIETVVINSTKLTSLSSYAFADTDIKYLVLPSTLTSMESTSFNNSSITDVYFTGTNKINITTSTVFTNLNKYYYIENEADVPNDEYNYWHYDSDGKIAIWEKQS